jgi:arylsulfatase A-like enzyme
MHPTRGFSHGFDLYSTPPITRDFFRTLSLATPWIEAQASAPFFLFLHNYDHHSKYMESDCVGCDIPYYPPRQEYLHFAKELQEPPTLRAEGRPRATDLLFAALNGKQTLSPEEIEYMIALYDDSIRAVDDGIGQFFGKLKALGIYDKALIILTADHGENFGEHGQYLHEHIFEGAARVPLLIRFPGGEFGGKRVKDMVQLTDLAPTIFDVLKLEAPKMDGESLLPVVRDGKKPLDKAFIQRLNHVAVRTNDWKLIRDTETKVDAMYQIATDPDEANDRISSQPAELAALREALDTFVNETPQTPGGTPAQQMTEEDIEALRSLGYAGDVEVKKQNESEP